MSKLEICPVCCEGNLQPYFFSRELKYKNISCTAQTFQASKCDACGTTSANAQQTKANKLMALNFERSVDGYLHTEEISKIRKKLGLSQRRASTIICGGGNSFAKYESGAVKQSAAVDNLLRVLEATPSALSVLIEADQQRRALSAVKEEFYIPVLTYPTEPQISPVVSFVKEMVSVVQTIFSPLQTDDEKIGPQSRAVKFNITGLTK